MDENGKEIFETSDYNLAKDKFAEYMELGYLIQ